MKNYILSLDQGTTRSRAIIFDKNQNIVAMSQREFTQIYPNDGWVEHDPMEIFSSQYSVMMEVIAKSAGFRDPGYFSRIFKQKTGFTPSEYQHQLEQRVDFKFSQQDESVQKIQ